MKKDLSKKPEPRMFLGRVRSKKGKKTVRKGRLPATFPRKVAEGKPIHRAWGLASRLKHVKTKEKKK